MPSASWCFLLVFYIAGNQYQTESKQRKTFCGFLWTRRDPVGRRSTWGCPKGGTTQQGATVGPGAARWVVPTSVASRTPSLPYKSPNIPNTLGVALDQKFRRRKASVSTRSNLDPVSASCRRGRSSSVAIFIISAATMMRRE